MYKQSLRLKRFVLLSMNFQIFFSAPIAFKNLMLQSNQNNQDLMDQEDISKKTQEFIEKNQELLNEKKYYQFAQKVKLMAHRKLQSKKANEAQAMFRMGARALLSIQEVEENIPLQLLQQLVQVYKSEPSLLNHHNENQFLKLVQSKPVTTRKVQLVRALIEKTGKPSQHPTLTNFYVNFFVNKNDFSKVERMAAFLNPKNSIEFIQKWTAHSQVLKQQKAAIWCRMVLERGVIHSIDDAQQIFKNVTDKFQNDDPFTVFTGLLLKSTRIGSKQAYLTIGRSYEEFLKSDHFFGSLYSSYGHKYFGVEKKSGGLMSLIQ